MSVDILRYDPDIKRLRTFVDQTDDIQWYTRNNLYPQIVESIRDRSYTIKSACKNLSTFLKGEGFEDVALADIIVNSRGQKLTDILRHVVLDASSFSNSFVLHLGVNMLGEYNNISAYPLRYWRFGIPDGNGDVSDYKYNSNWEQDPYKEVEKGKRIYTYPKFNPDKRVILEQIEEWGLGYPGQVLYFTKIEDEYPLATFDSVLDQGQTQEEIGIFRLASIQNGMNAGSIFSYPGKFENKKKEDDFKYSLNEYKGGKGANSIIVIEDEGGTRKAQDLITPLTIQNADKIHEFISKDDKNSIMEAFSQPKGIMGIFPESGMFNQQQLEEEYNYYNATTRDDRRDISETFRKVLSNWHTPIESDFKIRELSYNRMNG